MSLSKALAAAAGNAGGLPAGWQFECYFRINTNQNSGDMGIIVDQYVSGEDGRLLFGWQDSSIVMRVNGGTVYLSKSGLFPTTWYHVLLNYDGTTHRLFVNGNLADSATNVPSLYTGVSTSFGGQPSSTLVNYDLDGYLQGIHVEHNPTNLKTSSFGPPTVITETDDTVLLIEAAGSSITDTGPNSYTLNFNSSSVTVESSVVPSGYSRSIKFDGTDTGYIKVIGIAFLDDTLQVILMYVKVENNVASVYSIKQLKIDYPNISWPKTITNTLLEEYSVYPLSYGETPDINEFDQSLVVSTTPIKQNGNWIVNFEIINKTEEEKQEYKKEVSWNIREKRNSLLVATDWMGMSDVTMTAEWAAYRQALRDITDHANFPNLTETDWPTKPE